MRLASGFQAGFLRLQGKPAVKLSNSWHLTSWPRPDSRTALALGHLSVSKLSSVSDCTLPLEGGQKSFGAIKDLIQLLPAPRALLCYELQLPQSQQFYVDQVDICQGHLFYLLRHVCSTEGRRGALWVFDNPDYAAAVKLGMRTGCNDMPSASLPAWGSLTGSLGFESQQSPHSASRIDMICLKGVWNSVIDTLSLRRQQLHVVQNGPYAAMPCRAASGWGQAAGA